MCIVPQIISLHWVGRLPDLPAKIRVSLEFGQLMSIEIFIVLSRLRISICYVSKSINHKVIRVVLAKSRNVPLNSIDSFVCNLKAVCTQLANGPAGSCWIELTATGWSPCSEESIWLGRYCSRGFGPGIGTLRSR